MKWRVIDGNHCTWICQLCDREFSSLGAFPMIGEHDSAVCEMCLARSPVKVAKMFRERIEETRKSWDEYLAKMGSLADELENLNPETWREIANERGRMKLASEAARGGV